MTIPEQQLKLWAGIGAQKGSADTYSSVKTAIAAYNWPATMGVPKVYLQGSYPNHTNIRGDSDVDILVETGKVFYTNVASATFFAAGYSAPMFTWLDFRDEVKKSLINYYGPNYVKQSDRCIKVKGRGNRLNADIIPCNVYQYVQNGYIVATGITFWTTTGIQVINYPKYHLDNGSAKNNLCFQNFKPNVRIFKNARNQVNNGFPSYFLECLLYNVPNSYFSNSHNKTFVSAVRYLNTAKNKNSLGTFLCQNERQRIFGAAKHQIDTRAGETFINDLAKLWNNWS